jgi:hypothetical protein
MPIAVAGMILGIVLSLVVYNARLQNGALPAPPQLSAAQVTFTLPSSSAPQSGFYSAVTHRYELRTPLQLRDSQCWPR